MPSKRHVGFFVLDVLLAADTIKRYAKHVPDAYTFVKNEVYYDAIMREFEIIGEAIKHILSSSELKHAINEEWRNIIGFRNLVAHEYFAIDFEECFHILHHDLPILEKEIFALLQEYTSEKDIDYIFKHIRNDLVRIGRDESIHFLDTLKAKLAKN